MRTILLAFVFMAGTASAQVPPPFFQEDPTGQPSRNSFLDAYAGKAATDAAIAREAFILGGPAVAAQPYVPAPPSQGVDTGAILNGAMQNYDRQYREYRLDKAIRAQENRGLLMPN